MIRHFRVLGGQNYTPNRLRSASWRNFHRKDAFTLLNRPDHTSQLPRRCRRLACYPTSSSSWRRFGRPLAILGRPGSARCCPWDIALPRPGYRPDSRAVIEGAVHASCRPNS
jgi:hypothetical protein